MGNVSLALKAFLGRILGYHLQLGFPGGQSQLSSLCTLHRLFRDASVVPGLPPKRVTDQERAEEQHSELHHADEEAHILGDLVAPPDVLRREHKGQGARPDVQELEDERCAEVQGASVRAQAPDDGSDEPGAHNEYLNL